MNVLFLGYPNACLERLEIGKDRTRVPVFAGHPPVPEARTSLRLSQ